MSVKDRPSASELQRLLADRHVKDTYVPECKMADAGSRILDGWALLPTWSPLTTVGYEIKVSRSDWLQDSKWEEYRQVCHLMFIVAPKGVISASELPQGVGCLEPIGQGTGRRLVMRVKPVRQEPDTKKLVRLMAHVLMWRKDERGGVRSRERQAEFWREWVEQRKDFYAIGRSVRGRMRTMLKEAIEAKAAAEARANALSEAEAVLRELNIPLHGWQLRRNIERAFTAEADGGLQEIRSAIASLTALQARIERAAGRQEMVG